MQMTSTRPTVVLVHGGWHGPWCWEAVESRLEEKGIEVETVALGSSGADADRLGDLYSDAEQTRECLEALDGPVVVVAHSHGGLVASDAAAGLANVEHIVFVASFLLDEGGSLRGLTEQALGVEDGEAPEIWILAEDGRSMLPRDPGALYDDCPPEVAEAAVARLQPLSVAAVSQGVRAAAWREVPTTYVVCAKDHFFPPELQEQMASRATNSLSIQADHSPFLSHPDELTEIIAGVVEDVTGAGARA
jgi:pimeloyl-ACP methyl ester carboxylesterase